MNLLKKTNNFFLINDSFKRSIRFLSDKKLFTPGPLSTSKSVKEAMLHDLGSRDNEFIQIIVHIQDEILNLANTKNSSNYASVLMQGSGTFGVESVFQTISKPQKNNVLILENGSYGKRMANICKLLEIRHQVISFPEDRSIDLNKVESFISNHKNFTDLSIVHCETTSGVLNPVEEIGKLVKKYSPNSTYIVDSISAFGAIQIDLEKSGVDFLISSSNKCIQSVPGFSFVVCLKEKLLSCKNNSKSLCLDLYDQYVNFLNTKQFRFTPPVHSLLAFKRALIELENEGGPKVRYQRYCNNHKIVREKMIKIGFKELVPYSEQSRLINSFFYPKHKNFDFEDFYNRLNLKGQVIYPGKVTISPCFRIGNIGNLFEQDMHNLVECIEQVLADMNISTPIN